MLSGSTDWDGIGGMMSRPKTEEEYCNTLVAGLTHSSGKGDN